MYVCMYVCMYLYTYVLKSIALLYTPDREHFGIVPCEAMAMGCPVLAVATGGPLETVVHGSTGFLLEQVSVYVYIYVYVCHECYLCI